MELYQSATQFHEVCFKTGNYGNMVLFFLSSCGALAAFYVVHEKKMWRNCTLVCLLSSVLVYSVAQTVI